MQHRQPNDRKKKQLVLTKMREKERNSAPHCHEPRKLLFQDIFQEDLHEFDHKETASTLRKRVLQDKDGDETLPRF